MTQTEMTDLVREQLALDLGCDPVLLDEPGNTVTEWQDRPGRRRYSADEPFLEIAVWQGKLAVACRPELLPWARHYFAERPAQWLFQPPRCRELDAALDPFGYEIGNARKFYLPDLTFPPVEPQGTVRWYEGEELEQFRGVPYWGDALCFNPLFPDRIAVVAVGESGELMAMAGASQDGPKLWQIGINVRPEFRGRGLAVHLTALLKQELLKRGLAPFYGTAESHIVSQNVALSAGFRPAFAYLYAQRKGI